MTKKSAARLERDAKKKAMKNELADNRCWDDLFPIYQQAKALLTANAEIHHLLKDRDLLMHVTDVDSLVAYIRTLSNDLRQLDAELEQIHDMHRGKTGGSDDVDVVFGTFEIAEHYHAFMMRHEANVMPTVTYILDQLHRASVARDEANRPEDEKISDAEIIEATPVVDASVGQVEQPAEQSPVEETK